MLVWGRSEIWDLMGPRTSRFFGETEAAFGRARPNNRFGALVMSKSATCRSLQHLSLKTVTIPCQ